MEACRHHRPAAPYRGGKYTALEGGTRIPFIVCWPGRVTPGQSAALMSQVDLGRTLATLVGQEIPAGSMPDGENHLPALLGDTLTARSELVEQSLSSGLALRVGQYKYISRPREQLYDLSTDAEEKNNLAPQKPELTKQMRDRLQKIQQQDAEQIEPGYLKK